MRWDVCVLPICVCVCVSMCVCVCTCVCTSVRVVPSMTIAVLDLDSKYCITCNSTAPLSNSSFSLPSLSSFLTTDTDCMTQEEVEEEDREELT